MPSDLQPGEAPSRARTLVALILVALTVFGAWKFIEYRTQPPAPPEAVSAPL